MHYVAQEKTAINKRCSPDPALPRSGRDLFGETWAMPGSVGSLNYSMSVQILQNRHNTRIKRVPNFIMNMLIIIVMDETNYRRMAQFSHIVAKLFLCGRLGHGHAPWPWLNSPTVSQLSHISLSSSPCIRNFSWNQKHWMAFDDIDSLNALMTEEYHRYIRHHKRTFYYLLLICQQIVHLRVNCLQFFFLIFDLLIQNRLWTWAL